MFLKLIPVLLIMSAYSQPVVKKVLDVKLDKTQILQLGDEGGSSGAIEINQVNNMSEFVCWVAEYKRPHIQKMVSNWAKVKQSCAQTPIHFVSAVLMDQQKGILSAITIEDSSSPTGYRTFFNIDRWMKNYMKKTGDIKAPLAEELFELVFHERLLGAGEADKDYSMSRHLNLSLKDWELWKSKDLDKIKVTKATPVDSYNIQKIKISNIVLTGFPEASTTSPLLNPSLLWDDFYEGQQEAQHKYLRSCDVQSPVLRQKFQNEVLKDIATYTNWGNEVKFSNTTYKRKINSILAFAQKSVIQKFVPEKSGFNKSYMTALHYSYPITLFGCGKVHTTIEVEAPGKNIVNRSMGLAVKGKRFHLPGMPTDINSVFSAKLVIEQAFNSYLRSCEERKVKTYSEYGKYNDVLYIDCQAHKRIEMKQDKTSGQLWFESKGEIYLLEEKQN